MDGSYQSLEALPIEHLQIVFVASSSCSEDDATSNNTTNTTTSSSTAVSAPVCQQRPAVKKNTGLANGYTNPAPPKAHDVRAKGKKVPSKMAATRRLSGRSRERGKKAEVEKKTGVEEEVLDAPPDGWPLRRVISIEEDHLPHLLHGGPQPLLHQLSEEEDEEEEDDEGEEGAQSDVEPAVATAAADIPASPTPSHIPVLVGLPPERRSRFARAKKTPTSPRGQPVGKETQQVGPQLWFFKVTSMLNMSVKTVRKVIYSVVWTEVLIFLPCLCFLSPSEGKRRSPVRSRPSV